MGWLFPYHTTTKEILVQDLINPKRLSDASPWELQAHSLRGNNLWLLYRHKTKPMHLIGLDLIAYDKTSGTYGHKDMDESVHPYYYDCPKSWLKIVAGEEAPSEGSQKWRDAVAARYAAKKEVTKLKAGMKVLCNGQTYTLMERLNRANTWRVAGVGGYFRMTRKTIDQGLVKDSI